LTRRIAFYWTPTTDYDSDIHHYILYNKSLGGSTTIIHLLPVNGYYVGQDTFGRNVIVINGGYYPTPNYWWIRSVDISGNESLDSNYYNPGTTPW
jgi:hypothetical protein